MIKTTIREDLIGTTFEEISARFGQTIATVTRDGELFGRVVAHGVFYRASRKHGDANDIRRYAPTFRNIEKAVAWIQAGAAHTVQPLV